MSDRRYPLTPFGLLADLYDWAEDRAAGSALPTWAWLLMGLATVAGTLALWNWVLTLPTARSAWLPVAGIVVLVAAAACVIVGVVRTLRNR